MSSANGIEEKFTAFCSWVQKMTGRPVIKARRRMNVQLSELYCTVDLLSAPIVSKDLMQYKDDYPETVDHPIRQRIRGLVYATFKISSYGGDDALQCLHRLHASFRTDSWLVFSKKNSFGLGELEGVENLSAEFMSAAFENRGQMKASFYIPIPEDFDEDYFTWGTLTTVVENVDDKNIKEEIYGIKYQ